MSMPQSDWMIALYYAITYLVILGVTELWYHFRKPPTEQTRKFGHVMAGLLCMTFSYTLESHWTVLVIITAFIALMVVTKKVGLLRSIHDIERPSSGAIYFPAAVYITYYLSSTHGEPHLYLIAILVLTLSDSFAALIGVIYGANQYRVDTTHRKSIEGTIVFFLTTFLIVHLGLLLLSDIGRVESVLCALLVTLLITGLESISLDGADNLFIPIVTWFVLAKSIHTPVENTLTYLGMLTGIYITFLVTVRWPKPKLGNSAVVGVTLLGYSAWALISFNWFIPILMATVLFCHSRLLFEHAKQAMDVLRIRPIFYVTILPCVLIFVADLKEEWQLILLLPFIVSLASQFSISWCRNCRTRKDQLERTYPRFIVEAPPVLRAFILALVFVPLQFFFESQLPMLLTFGLGYIGIWLVDRLYWSVANRFPDDWPQATERVFFLRLSLAVRTIVSLLIIAGNLAWYYNWI